MLFIFFMWWRILLFGFHHAKTALWLGGKKISSWRLINKLSLANEIPTSSVIYIFFFTRISLTKETREFSSYLAFLCEHSSCETFSSISLPPLICFNWFKNISSICLSLLTFINLSISDNFCQSIFRNFSSISMSLLVFINIYISIAFHLSLSDDSLQSFFSRKFSFRSFSF